MTKSERDLTSDRLNALMKADPNLTPEGANKLLHRWAAGRVAPSVKQADRVLKKAGLA